MPYWSGPLVLVFCWCNEFLIRPGGDKKRYILLLCVCRHPQSINTDQHKPVNNTKSWIARMIAATILNCREEFGNHLQWHEQLIYGLLETLPRRLSIKLSTRSAIWISYYVHDDDSEICYVFIVLAAAGNMILWIFHCCFVDARKRQNIRWGHPSQWCCAHNLLTLLAPHWRIVIHKGLWLVGGSSGRPGVCLHIVRLSGRLSLNCWFILYYHFGFW